MYLPQDSSTSWARAPCSAPGIRDSIPGLAPRATGLRRGLSARAWRRATLATAPLHTQQHCARARGAHGGRRRSARWTARTSASSRQHMYIATDRTILPCARIRASSRHHARGGCPSKNVHPVRVPPAFGFAHVDLQSARPDASASPQRERGRERGRGVPCRPTTRQAGGLRPERADLAGRAA